MQYSSMQSSGMRSSKAVPIPPDVQATIAATPAGASALLDSLTPTSPLRAARCERLLSLRPGERAGVVLIGPSESSLLLLRDIALALAELLPVDVGVYGVGCYDPYRPGYRRPLASYTTRLASVIDTFPAPQPVGSGSQYSAQPGPAQPALARARVLRTAAAAEVKASINCISREMFPSFSGCHCTPTTHQLGSFPSKASISPSGARAAAR